MRFVGKTDKTIRINLVHSGGSTVKYVVSTECKPCVRYRPLYRPAWHRQAHVGKNIFSQYSKGVIQISTNIEQWKLPQYI
jgi:hypothetical protein